MMKGSEQQVSSGGKWSLVVWYHQSWKQRQNRAKAVNLMTRQNNPSLILTHTLKSDKTERPLQDEEIMALTTRAVESTFWLGKFLIFSL